MAINKSRTWYLKLIASLLAVFIGLLCFTLYKVNQFSHEFMESFCATTIHRLFPSPDAKWILVTFDIDCGATTSFNMQTSLLPAGAEFSPKKYPSFFFVHGQHDLTAHWVDHKKIEIKVPRGEKVSQQEAKVNSIEVIYK